MRSKQRSEQGPGSGKRRGAGPSGITVTELAVILYERPALAGHWIEVTATKERIPHEQSTGR